MEKIIAIDGMSGAGKNTILEIICDKLNITGIHGDELMKDAARDMPELVKKLFGEEIGNEEPFTYLNRNLFSKPSIEMRPKYYSSIRPYAENETHEIFLQLFNGNMPTKHLSAIYNPQFHKDILAIEFLGLNQGNDIWPEAISRIIIQADKEIRRQRTNIRRQLGDSKEYDATEARTQAYKDFFENPNADYFVNNNGSIQLLKQQVDEIIATILQRLRYSNNQHTCEQ
jgi:dephospho-CoA kinase